VTRRRVATTTRAFGAGGRESHDASPFYARFGPRVFSSDESVAEPFSLAEPLICGDARRMPELPDNSVALVVTSPPYFAGKEYEQALGEGGVPASYLEYLELLREVFTECRRVLEPGGRLAVNVANLGRRPYRSLAADVIHLLDDQLGFLLRGEIVWKKADGATGSCAWGSYCSPTNPVLRDVTERIIVASKGRFDRAPSVRARQAAGRPSEATITVDEFLAGTLDLWEMRPESARRVGHPAPFPVELPERLIQLYTFRGDLVLDPFLGSGTTALAAARTGRLFVGYDTEPAYVELARARLRRDAARGPGGADGDRGKGPKRREAARRRGEGASGPTPEGSAVEALEGHRRNLPRRPAREYAAERLRVAGFREVTRESRVPGVGIVVSATAVDGAGRRWFFDVVGEFTVTSTGLGQTEALWRVLGRANVLAHAALTPFVVLTTQVAEPGSLADRAVRTVGPAGLFDVIDVLSDEDCERLAAYAAGGQAERPVAGFWSPDDVARFAGSSVGDSASGGSRGTTWLPRPPARRRRPVASRAATGRDVALFEMPSSEVPSSEVPAEAVLPSVSARRSRRGATQPLPRSGT
jgi:DNA modification methylase